MRAPSAASSSDMPAANRTGNTKIDQGDRPFDISDADRPRRLISDAVSKPRPNRNPTKNMCQLRVTLLNKGVNRRDITPLSAGA